MVDISLISDYLLFPLFCIYYNQSTKSSSIAVTFFKTFMFSIPMTIIEYLLEPKTNLIKYQKGWTRCPSFSLASSGIPSPLSLPIFQYHGFI
ncbi:CBO0543 family protein [Halalkalibacter suaedae]|uniref:CBO0543 family protein n=1 Tax=Halalkalibacter suaedae TaxID=2822140 RepID=UPI003AF180DC